MSEVSFNQKYEVFSPLSYEYFKKRNLFDLLVGICNYRRADFERVPMMKKYYHCAKQCFVKEIVSVVVILSMRLDLLKKLKTYLVVN